MEALDMYIRDDVERLGSRLNGIHERMKFHLTELLVRIKSHYNNVLVPSFSNLSIASGSYRYWWGWLQNVQ